MERQNVRYENDYFSSKLTLGFTLLELMVTLVIAVIVLTIAVPSFMGLIARNSLTGNANEFVSAFNLARNEAIKLNQDTRLCHSQNGVVCSDPGVNSWQGWLIIDSSDVVIASGLLSSKLIITGSANTDVIRFTSNGLVRNDANGTPLSGTFTVCSELAPVSQNTRLINFVSGGRVSVSNAQTQDCA